MRAFIVAMECEANAVRPSLKADDRLYVCGIGKVNAAAATQKAIDEGADLIINAGVCGGFGNDVAIGGVYEVKSAVEYDFDLAQINHTRIGQLQERDSPFIPASPIGAFPAKILASGDRFNDNEADHDLIVREFGAELRDMEGAAIAHVCEKNGIKFRAFKCVTDVAGCGSMVGQYEENLPKVMETLKMALIRHV